MMTLRKRKATRLININDECYSGACPSCGTLGNSFKNGITSSGKQRYKCRDCQKVFIPNARRRGNPREAGECQNHPGKRAYAHELCHTCWKRKRRHDGLKN